ncbi:hypothetical protein [Variovorax sp. dw_954]|uniref:hypothetical protein n=1 Tax=Variovorax sp. dw_954 TaxID=2720078 RepID=UPI001BD51AAE|nr:hypothetical protein [Variovorax sp. dw_954]
MAQPLLRSIAIVSLALSAHLAGIAATSPHGVWRCGSTYTDQPCKEGKSLNVDDSRSEADRRAADNATRRNQVEADQMERTRLRRDKDAIDRDRKAAAEARRFALAERRAASAERVHQARIRKLEREPRKSTMKFKGPETRTL